MLMKHENIDARSWRDRPYPQDRPGPDRGFWRYGALIGTLLSIAIWIGIWALLF